MGCSSCGSSSGSYYRSPQVKREDLSDCNFTVEMLVDWKDKLICVKDNNKLSELGIDNAQYNSFLGTILSGINISYNICYLAEHLNKVQPIILKIIALNLC